MKPTERRASDDNPDVDHEESDINVRAILWFVGGLVVVAAMIHAGLWGLFELYLSRAELNDPQRPPLAVPLGSRPPEPRLQGLPFDASEGWLTPRQDLESFRRTEEQRLNGYGWVDPQAGVVHIPIARAMDLFVQRQAGSTPAAAPSPQLPAPTDAGAPYIPRAWTITQGNANEPPE